MCCVSFPGGSGSNHSELPCAFLPVRGGVSPSSNFPRWAVSPQTSQWQLGSAPGVEAFSTIRTSSCASDGGALHSSGGATASSSSAVKQGSSSSPCLNAGLASLKPARQKASSSPSRTIASPALRAGGGREDNSDCSTAVRGFSPSRAKTLG